MSRSANHDALPIPGPTPFLTDGGLETTLIFREGLSLPHFAAFPLLRSDAGRATLQSYFARYMAIARRYGTGFILESVTWRASEDWGSLLGFSPADLRTINRQAIEFLVEIREEHRGHGQPILISGCVGPRGDGYSPNVTMSAANAETYHRPQIETFRDSAADLVTGMTMTYPAEAIGIVRGAKACGMKAVISFTVETDGRLPSGSRLAEAIAEVDAATDGGPSFYMVNCAHPSHFAAELSPDADWARRVQGVRVNASCKSHAELNDSCTLDDGDPTQLGMEVADLRRRLPHMTVLGGCCGTDERHVEAIIRACQPGGPTEPAIGYFEPIA